MRVSLGSRLPPLALFALLAMPGCYSVIPERGVMTPESGPPELHGGRIYIPYSRTHYKSTVRRAGLMSQFSNDVQDETKTQVTKVEALGGIVLELPTEECHFEKKPPPTTPRAAAATLIVGDREFGWRTGSVVELRAGADEVVYLVPLAMPSDNQRWLPSAPWPIGETHHHAQLVRTADRLEVQHQDGAVHALAAGDAAVLLFGDRYAATSSGVYDLRSRHRLLIPGVTKIGLNRSSPALLIESPQQRWFGDADLSDGEVEPPNARPLGAFGQSIYFHAVDLSTLMRFDAVTRTWHEVPYLRCAPHS